MSTTQIQVIRHNFIRMTGELTLYVDPFKVEPQEERHDADIILITHDHYDHYSPEDIKKVSAGHTIIVVPTVLKTKAGTLAPKDGAVFSLEPCETLKFGPLSIEAVPAYNTDKDFHKKDERWIGYIIDFGDVTVYVAGDTDVTKENSSVRCDIACVPIGGTYTMDAAQAAGLVNIIRPAVAIPTHYACIVGTLADADIFRSMVDPSIEVRTFIK